MNRKEFIKTCGHRCLSILAISVALPACTPPIFLQKEPLEGKLIIDKSDFLIAKNKRKKNRSYIIIKSEHQNYPIVVYRISDSNYEALLLQCTHQNAELNVNGDVITCPAHGSEFNKKGETIQGPAEQKLKNFKVTQDIEKIYIHLT